MIKIIAEIGINYADQKGPDYFIDNIIKMVDIANVAGCDYVKFQKRNPDSCVPEDKKNNEKNVPWHDSSITYLQYKKEVELTKEQVSYVDYYCRDKKIGWFSSVWDIDSAYLISTFSNIVKIPSAHVTNIPLLELCKNLFSFRIMSTGMSTEDEIKQAVDTLEPNVIMHTNSVYPTLIDDLYMQYIFWLKEKYPNCEIGYSSHYYGIKDVITVVPLGVTWIEKHITLNHDNWGSDQKVSVEPNGLFELIKGVRDMERGWSKGYEARSLLPGEENKRSSLRIEKNKE
mgnify:CR=1 FL=1